MGFPDGASGKESACRYRRCKRCRFNPWVKKVPWRRALHPTPVFWPGECHGQGSLVGYSPLGHTEQNTTGPLTLQVSSDPALWSWHGDLRSVYP